MRDIRILTLFKQHYMQTYDVSLDSEYSCWGSTDGMDVDVLSEDLPRSIPGIWEAIGRKQDEVNGGWSSQSIGLIRCSLNNVCDFIGDNYWNEKDDMPFFAVAFLKLYNKMNYRKVAEEIENQYNDVSLSREKDKKCNVISYTTFNNVDLILFLNSNNLNYMGECLQDIMHNQNIQYLYPIVSVSNKYLEFCRMNGGAMDFWKGTRCFVDDPLEKITLTLQMSGNPHIVNYIKGMMEEQLNAFRDVKYSFGFSHDSLVIEIPNADVKTLLRFSLPTGIITHQNPLYGKEIYNIETSFVMRFCSVLDLESMYTDETQSVKRLSWCKNQLTNYRNKLKQIQKQGDNSLSCYYQAIVQSLNSLVQYEQYDLAREVFYLICPTFDMFTRLLTEAESKVEKNYDLLNNGMKQTIQCFVDSVNSVMYHTLSSGQALFMIPGRGSISFTVPIKLILMYLWVIKQVAYILNDCGYEYQCILTTEMEARPVTTLLDFNMDDDNRLICVRTANRLLFWPRNLMIILAHEIGHYIGKDLRMRKLRAECVMRTLSYALAEAIFPLIYNGDCLTRQQGELFRSIKRIIKKHLRIRAIKFLTDEIKYRGAIKEYYANQLETELQRLCQMFLRELNDEWADELPDVFEPIVVMAQKQEGDFREKLQYIYKVYGVLRDNIHYHMSTNTFQKVVWKVIKVYQESFSDIAAYAILNFSVREFEESFRVSEGIIMESNPKTDEQVIREYVIRNVTQTNGDDYSKEDEKNDDYKFGEMSLADQIYNFVWCRLSLLNYAKICYKGMQRHIQKPDVASEVETLRKYYSIFQGEQDGRDIYSDILCKADLYMQSIEQEYAEYEKK